jgi:hypothetical protein
MREKTSPQFPLFHLQKMRPRFHSGGHQFGAKGLLTCKPRAIGFVTPHQNRRTRLITIPCQQERHDTCKDTLGLTCKCPCHKANRPTITKDGPVRCSICGSRRSPLFYGKKRLLLWALELPVPDFPGMTINLCPNCKVKVREQIMEDRGLTQEKRKDARAIFESFKNDPNNN